MNSSSIGILVALFVLGLSVRASLAGHAHPIRYARWDRAAAWSNANVSWHGPFNHVQWGRPLALIVPPTANMQTHYAWGVGRTRMTPIHHQFGRPHPQSAGSATQRPTPAWPSDTQQHGVYYLRGPW